MPMQVLLRVVVDATVRLDEPADRFSSNSERVSIRSRPSARSSTSSPDRSEDDVFVVPLHHVAKLGDEVRTVTVMLHDHPSVLEVVDLQLTRDGTRVCTPQRAM
jgi:hypothetical protein